MRCKMKVARALVEARRWMDRWNTVSSAINIRQLMVTRICKSPEKIASESACRLRKKDFGAL